MFFKKYEELLLNRGEEITKLITPDTHMSWENSYKAIDPDRMELANYVDIPGYLGKKHYRDKKGKMLNMWNGLSWVYVGRALPIT